MTDTIVAISTANGNGAISIVRMSGKDSVSIAEKLTKTSFSPDMLNLQNFII